MFKLKPKKVFEKINKMDRKQAYTIGAIVVVSIIALLMLLSAVTGGEDGSFEGMKTHGYDLANMPFATDEAEKFLLANAYPDMQENGSTLLYSSAEKEARQEEDEQNADAMSLDEPFVENSMAAADESGAMAGEGGSSGGYQGSGSGRAGGGGHTKTEVGQLAAAGMASAGGNGMSGTWGPTGDFHQYKGREDRGNEAPVQLKTSNARNALAQFRSGSLAAARQNNNKMKNAGKALYGGYVDNSDLLGKPGVDLSKVGGLQLDTSAPPTTTDLDNLDDKVADAVKKGEEKQKEEEKLSFWEQLLQDLARQAASALVSSIMDGVGDHVRGWIGGNRASRAARKEYGSSMAGKTWGTTDSNGKYQQCANCLTEQQVGELKQNGVTKENWGKYSSKQQAKAGSKTATARSKGAEEKVVYYGKSQGTSGNTGSSTGGSAGSSTSGSTSGSR